MISTAEYTIVLASFARMVSRGNNGNRYGHKDQPSDPLSPHTHSRQATLHAAHDSVHRLAGSFPGPYASGPLPGLLPPSHNTGSPRKPGRMPHAIGARPGSLTPSIHPKLGVKSRHQGLHRCALHRIFRPYLEEAVLTRILRRRIKS